MLIWLTLILSAWGQSVVGRAPLPLAKLAVQVEALPLSASDLALVYLGEGLEMRMARYGSGGVGWDTALTIPDVKLHPAFVFVPFPVLTMSPEPMGHQLPGTQLTWLGTNAQGEVLHTMSHPDGFFIQRVAPGGNSEFLRVAVDDQERDLHAALPSESGRDLAIVTTRKKSDAVTVRFLGSDLEPTRVLDLTVPVRGKAARERKLVDMVLADGDLYLFWYVDRAALLVERHGRDGEVAALEVDLGTKRPSGIHALVDEVGAVQIAAELGLGNGFDLLMAQLDFDGAQVRMADVHPLRDLVDGSSVGNQRMLDLYTLDSGGWVVATQSYRLASRSTSTGTGKDRKTRSYSVHVYGDLHLVGFDADGLRVWHTTVKMKSEEIASRPSSHLVERVYEAKVAGASLHVSGGLLRAVYTDTRGHDQLWYTTLDTATGEVLVDSKLPVDLGSHSVLREGTVNLGTDGMAMVTLGRRKLAFKQNESEVLWLRLPAPKGDR